MCSSDLMEQGFSVATMKFIQTGNNGFSEDILAHRRIMGISPLPEDHDLTTSPVIFTYPASAQLAARIDGRDIDVASIDRSVETLSGRYDIVLVEGAGGLMVPIADDFFTVDYVASRKLPIIIDNMPYSKKQSLYYISCLLRIVLYADFTKQSSKQPLFCIDIYNIANNAHYHC